ncbi:hypothetical protein scyTo_0020598 [Scyliorhinus torazame]|uniref:Uncharacterized protein n=1 Tax=Scyliorhinus torazame TaxID=75743 RepID=A0A401PXA3_SCYTO|nr:hypothetical protein [Scyliorhinus torazame]
MLGLAGAVAIFKMAVVDSASGRHALALAAAVIFKNKSKMKKPPLAPKPKLQERPSSLAVPKRIPSQIPKSAAVPTSAPGSKGTKPPIAPKPNLASQATLTQHNNLNRSSNGKLFIADPLLVVNVNELDITDPLGESESSVSCPGAQADRAAADDGHNALRESQTSKYHENGTRMFYGGEQEVTLQEENGFVQLVTSNMDPSDLGTELDLQCFEKQTVVVCINADGADDGDRLNDATWDDCFFQGTSQSKTHAAHPHRHQHSKEENISFAAGEPDGPGEKADSPRQEADGRGDEADGCGDEADGPGEEADGPGEGADGPGEGADGPREEADGPGEEADGPGEKADNPGVEADSPGEEADNPGVEADGPREEVDGPGEGADGPGEKADSPWEEADNPGVEADGLGEEADNPGEEADGSGEEADGPGEEADGPGEEADNPGEEADGLGEKADSPGEEESSPNNEPMELSFDSITAEQKEFSAREDHTDACTDNITVEARPTTCKCILPCLIGTECSPLLEQNTEHAEKIDVSSASADLRQVNEWFAKIEGDKSVIADWNDMRTRTRSLSTKVPETVPEETVAESPLQTLCERVIGDPKPVKMDGEVCENMRMIPAKHRRHTFYPRSYSVESRDMPIFVHRETEVSHLDDSRMKRMEDNFSLPSVSSGSQLKCNPLPTSTPSSVVDIPPPFQLASITKKPITKSSPSLLVESESPDKYLKQSAKKKSSFKRFLPIKLSLKKKIENKMAVEVNVCRTPSDTGRGLDFDGRSLGNSPQIKARFGKMCILDSSSTFLINKDGKRKGMPKPFSRSVSRVESFENKLRHSYTSLPLTKPRSISFPNTDTSDYENIPAVSSDYENIQIPPRRNGRSGTVTEFFEDSSRVFTSASENDGYVDMTSFAPFESRQNAEQDLER